MTQKWRCVRRTSLKTANIYIRALEVYEPNYCVIMLNRCDHNYVDMLEGISFFIMPPPSDELNIRSLYDAVAMKR